MSNGARILLMDSEVFFTYRKHLVGWCPGWWEGCGVSAVLSPSWASHSSSEPGQPFVLLWQWQWVLRGDSWHGGSGF